MTLSSEDDDGDAEEEVQWAEDTDAEFAKACMDYLSLYHGVKFARALADHSFLNCMTRDPFIVSACRYHNKHEHKRLTSI